MENNIIWEFSEGKLTSQEIEKVETELKIKFPKDYIEVVSENDGGYPDPNVFNLNSSEDTFNNLISLKADADYNIFQTMATVSDRLLGRIIPFGEDPGGNLICFDYRTSEVPTVVFWDHAIAGGGELEKAVISICDNFTELLEMLHEPEDD